MANDSLQPLTRRVKIITARGTLTAEITSITSCCHVITAAGETRTYRTADGPQDFIDILTMRLGFAPRFPLLPAPGVKAVALAAFVRRTVEAVSIRKAA